MSDLRRTDVVLVTNSDPQLHDPESPVLAGALEAAGITTEIVAWDAGVDWTAYRLALLRSTWDYPGRLVEFLDWAKAVNHPTTLLNPVDLLRWNSHKGYLVEIERRGVPTVPTVLIPAESTDVVAQLAECPWDEVVVKPAVGCGGRRVHRGRPDDPALQQTARALAEHGDVVVQAFAPQVSQGERSLVFFDGVYSHAVRKVPAEGDYLCHEHHGGSAHFHDADSAELRVALAALACVPAEPAYARVDLINWQDAPVVIELELIEPDLFLRGDPDRIDRLVGVVASRLRATAGAVGAAETR
ncbi:hypothetical protein [Lapillicoccus sp.]|uniref:ATP-grasp domain-containing protein n=1 Tax=Lapillicoccus sp. TaxID=1909287 RepID=UPI0025FF2E90|nr:hypothetical protein [Lapillicoccus sp.]